MSTKSLDIARISANWRIQAARLLAGPGADLRAGERFLQAAGSNHVRLDEWWGAWDSGSKRLRATALFVPSTGGTLMTFTSRIRSAESGAIIARLLDSACEQIVSGTLAQILLELDETDARDAFEQAGFLFVGDLLYLRRPWTHPGNQPSIWLAGVTMSPWRAGDDLDLQHALERSYIDTLDCPELCGLRETSDVIAGHRATGVFDESLWWIIRRDDTPAGALLLSAVPAQDHTELVYLGLGPELRGRGMGSLALRHGLAALAGRPHRTVLCAVDARNVAARRLYERTGFQEFSRRTAMVRALTMSRARRSQSDVTAPAQPSTDS